MAVVISSLVFTKKDIAGNSFVEGYFLVEFRDAGYTPGGEAMDLSSFMRRAEFVQATPASGALDYEARPSYTDYPGNAGSGRVTLHYLRSSLGISIISGTVNIAPAQLRAELLSGVAVSGARAIVHAIGA